MPGALAEWAVAGGTAALPGPSRLLLPDPRRGL